MPGWVTITRLRFATACGKYTRLRFDLVLNALCGLRDRDRRDLNPVRRHPWRTPIDVSDMARAIEWAIRRDPAAGGEILSVNAGSDARELSGSAIWLAVAAAGCRGRRSRSTARPRPTSALLDVADFSLSPIARAPGASAAVHARRQHRAAERGAGEYGFCRPEFSQLRADPSENARPPDREGGAVVVAALAPRRCGEPRGVKFVRTPLAGAYLIELDKRGDHRGFFARFFCEREFAEAGLETRFPQVNTSLTAAAGTLRGMHFQLPPAAEVKIVRCIGGALHDVIVDLRPDSPTYLKWFGADLSAENRAMMYAPRGFAHGFMTLSDDTEALYLVSAFYAPEHERGVRFDDPRFGIRWPLVPKEMSAKDREWPDYDPAGPMAEALRGCR